MDGVVLINKEAGYSSFDVVAKIRRALSIKKVGHCGTLDPQASGLLLVLLGRATKFTPFLIKHDKSYEAELLLGKASNTYDIWGKILEEKQPKVHNSHQIQEVLQSLLGKQLQKPPLYSAIKIRGKKLYEYARKGQEVEIKERTIEIKALDYLDYYDNRLRFRVHCSSGTYIRSLCVDIAAALGEIAVMSSLCRTAIGPHCLENADSMDKIDKNQLSIKAVEGFLSDFTRYDYADIAAVKNGLPLNLPDVGRSVFIYHNNSCIAYYSRGKDDRYYCQRGLW